MIIDNTKTKASATKLENTKIPIELGWEKNKNKKREGQARKTPKHREFADFLGTVI